SILSLGMDNVAILWDRQSGKRIRSFDNGASPLAYCSETDCLAIARQKDESETVVLQFWELSRGKLLREVGPLKATRIEALVFSRCGRYLAGRSTGSRSICCWIWDLNSGEVVRILEDRDRAVGRFLLAFSPQGRYLVSTSGTYGLIWDFCDHNSTPSSNN